MAQRWHGYTESDQANLFNWAHEHKNQARVGLGFAGQPPPAPARPSAGGYSTSSFRDQLPRDDEPRSRKAPVVKGEEFAVGTVYNWSRGDAVDPRLRREKHFDLEHETSDLLRSAGEDRDDVDEFGRQKRPRAETVTATKSIAAKLSGSESIAQKLSSAAMAKKLAKGLEKGANYDQRMAIRDKVQASLNIVARKDQKASGSKRERWERFDLDKYNYEDEVSGALDKDSQGIAERHRRVLEALEDDTSESLSACLGENEIRTRAPTSEDAHFNAIFAPPIPVSTSSKCPSKAKEVETPSEVPEPVEVEPEHGLALKVKAKGSWRDRMKSKK